MAALSFCVNDTFPRLEYDVELKRLRATNCIMVSILIKVLVLCIWLQSTVYWYIVRNIRIEIHQKLVTVCSDTIYIEKNLNWTPPLTVRTRKAYLFFSKQHKSIRPWQLPHLFNHFDTSIKIMSSIIKKGPHLPFVQWNYSEGFLDGITVTRITYSDVIIPGCGAGYKIRRQMVD